jgi:hypothetical protein
MTERDRETQQPKSELQLALDEARQLDEASRTGILELLDPKFYTHLPAHIVIERYRDVLLRNTNDARQIWAQRQGLGFRPNLTSADIQEQQRWQAKYENLAAQYQQLSGTDLNQNPLSD